jgi:hypothetical protein
MDSVLIGFRDVVLVEAIQLLRLTIHLVLREYASPPSRSTTFPNDYDPIWSKIIDQSSERFDESYSSSYLMSLRGHAWIGTEGPEK